MVPGAPAETVSNGVFMINTDKPKRKHHTWMTRQWAVFALACYLGVQNILQHVCKRAGCQLNIWSLKRDTSMRPRDMANFQPIAQE